MGASGLISTIKAEFSVVEVALPGEAPVAVGVIVHDPENGDFRLRFRRDWEDFAGEEAEVLSSLADDFERNIKETGADGWLGICEDQLSHTVRITDREEVVAESLDKAAERVYGKHVRPKVLPFRTHLPKFSARVAAGKFLDDHDVEAEEWLETPEGFRLETGMFVVQITGHSMEPRIPDGSLCVFRADVHGTRQGKLLLVERRDLSESGGRYTVKRYRSLKTQTEEGWQHTLIRLEPLNPDFEAWELEDDPELFRVIGEFVRVLE